MTAMRSIAWLFLSSLAFAAAAAPPGVAWKPRGEREPGASAPPGVVVKAATTDPTGDQFGSGSVRHDITRLSADIVGSNLVVTVSFAGTISAPNSGRADALVGYVDLDTDGNPNDAGSHIQNFCPTGQVPAIGTDFDVFLFGGSTSQTPVLSFDTLAETGVAATSYSSNSVTLSIPLSAIGHGSQPIRVATVLGTGPEPTDCAPNSTTLVASTATVGPAVQVTGSAQTGSTLTFRSPVTGVRYDWDFDGDGVIDRTGSSNALNVTYPGAYSGNVSVLTTDANGNRTISNMTFTAAAPRLTTNVSTTATQVCGDNDQFADPGETFRLPVRVTNSGNVTTSADASVAFSATDRVTAAVAGQAINGNLIVETPLVDVGAITPGAFVDRTVTVTVARTAACGSSVGFQFTGGFDGSSSAPGSSSSTTFNIPAVCNTFTNACPLLAQSKVDVVPRQGLYFNVNRPGNGLSNFVIQSPGQTPVFFGAWFTGGADRTPTWYVVQGNLVGNSVVAPIYRFTRNVASSTFSVNSTVVGTAVVAMKSTELMAFYWQIGNKQGLELMTYLTPGPAASPNRTGAWYNMNEPGWGKVIHAFSQSGANQIFAVDYIYDAAGEPRWVLTQASQAALASGGAGHQTYAVHCPGCPWISDWSTFPLNAGNGIEAFSGPQTGTTTTSFAFPNPLAGSWVRTNLPIIILTNPQ